MSGYAFPVTITLKNLTDTELIVNIPRGTIIEPESSHLAYQSAVITKDYIFRLNPQETRSVMLDAECWNEHLAPPQRAPGKLTSLKGNIQKTTNVWGTSSSPNNPLYTKPSQDAHIFAAFVNASPELAYEFLEQAIQWAKSDGKDVTVISQELKNTSSTPSGKFNENLCDFAQEEDISDYVSASRIREFFIKKDKETEDVLDAIRNLIRHVYTLTTHKVASNLYQLTRELDDLSNDRKFAMTDDKKRELTTLIRQKYTSILDALPLLDKIQWTE